MGNLSLNVMGGHDGGLFDYKLPSDITSGIWRALEQLEPGGKLFHPVRDIDSASDHTNLGTVHHKSAMPHSPDLFARGISRLVHFTFSI